MKFGFCIEELITSVLNFNISITSGNIQYVDKIINIIVVSSQNLNISLKLYFPFVIINASINETNQCNNHILGSIINMKNNKIEDIILYFNFLCSNKLQSDSIRKGVIAYTNANQIWLLNISSISVVLSKKSVAMLYAIFGFLNNFLPKRYELMKPRNKIGNKNNIF
jgi:hypothetical protein